MPKIYRIRYIPSEITDLSSDELLYRDNMYLITQCKPIKPRDDIFYGLSCIFIENGWKISAIMDQDKKIKYWYCDIIDICYEQENDTYFIHDLLTDVKIKPDGMIEVIDLDELAAAFEDGLITKEQMLASLRKTNNLLNLIYSLDMPTHIMNIVREFTGLEYSL